MPEDRFMRSERTSLTSLMHVLHPENASVRRTFPVDLLVHLRIFPTRRQFAAVFLHDDPSVV